MWTSENNWYKWYYDDDPIFGRQDQHFKKLYTNYSCGFSKSVLSFKEELENAAKSTLDHYPSLTPCIFFSGGVDSELILRSYLNIGSNPKVYIVRYENDYNLYDVSYAISICNSLEVKFNLIDFNLKKFYNNDAELISEQSQIDRPRMLPHLKFTECADGLIIVGHSDIRWFRTNDNYNVKGTWLSQDFESDIGCDKFNILHNRPAIYQWWKWTPGLIISYTNLKWFQNLINDQYYGKLGINSTKIYGFREIYPDLLYRKKQTGFENLDPLIKEFEDFLNIKYKGLPFRQCVNKSLNELILEIKNVNTRF